MPQIALNRGNLNFSDLMDRGLPQFETTPIEQPLEGDRPIKADFGKVDFGKIDFSQIHLDPLLFDRVQTEAVHAIQTPLQMAMLFINGKYTRLGGVSGFLGAPTIAVSLCPDGQGFFRHFQGGSIYWHPTTGAHEIHGLIRDRWAGMGWERSFLGYPTTDETLGTDPQSTGRFNHFQGGSLYWHPAIGTRLVYGVIREKYLKLGGEGSFLGYPVTDELGTPDGRGRFNHFQAGSIYWTPETGAQEVHGLIRNLWASQGWETNANLGYPITDELIPDRRIGHVHPESFRKPILNFPVDLVKLPAEGATLGFSPLVVNRSIASQVIANPAAKLDRTALGITAARTDLVRTDLVRTDVINSVIRTDAIINRVNPRLDSAIEIGSIVPPIAFFPTAQSTAAPIKSQNRFGDFENGVLFWKRGEANAQPLPPWTQSADGGKMTLSPSELIAKLLPQLQSAIATLSGLTYNSVSFVGTTGYWSDGVSSHNRKHRLNLLLNGMKNQSLGFISSSVPTTLLVELQVEVTLEPIARTVMGSIAQWFLPMGNQNVLNDPETQLHRAIDPLLWKSVVLIAIDDTNNGESVAVLSSKTMVNGHVNLYIEPT